MNSVTFTLVPARTAFSAFTSPDDLHINDWGYGCLAKLLAGSIHDAATRPTLTATVGHRR